VDWKFFSEEFPEYVGSSFNDAFLIETPTSTFVVNPDFTLTAPNNVAFDPSGELVTINTTGAVGMNSANAVGTTYDGATTTLTTVAAIPPGQSTITITFSVMDLGDSIYDTTVFLDNFRFSAGPGLSPLAQMRIPVRWCAITGAPSQINPGVVGEASLKDVLWRRHERVTDNIYQPQARITLRSGATASLPSFPVITDLNVSAGSQPGDVLDLNFDGGAEWRATINACRQAWRAAAPTVTGLTAVHIRRFVNAAGAPTGLLGLGGLPTLSNAASQMQRGDAMVIDNAYLLPGSPLQVFGPDPVDKLLGHELAHGVATWHGDGVDNDNDGVLDGPPHLYEGDILNGPNLMQYRMDGITITAAQAEQMRTQAFLHIPDREVEGAANALTAAASTVIPLGNTGIDTLGDVPAGMEFADVNEFGAAIDPTLGATYFFTNFNGVLPNDLTGLMVFFLADTDNNAATGGNPSAIGSGFPDVSGIEMAIKATVNVSNGAATATAEVFQFETSFGQFVALNDPGIGATVTKDLLSLLTADPDDHAEIVVSNGVSVKIPTSLLDPPIGMQIGLQVQTKTSTGDVIDGATTQLTFETEVFPSCQVTLAVAAPGDAVSIQVMGLPADSPIHALLGADEVATGVTDGVGNATVPFTIPSDAAVGDRLVTVGIDDPDNAITADCNVIVTHAPIFDVPPTPSPGTEFTVAVGSAVAINVQASDPENEDTVALNVIGAPSGASFAPTPGNPASGTFMWSPTAGQEGVYVITFTAIDNNGASAPPLSIVVTVIDALLGDCDGDGDAVDLFDILACIDIVLERVTPTPTQQVTCNVTCDDTIDLFDVLRKIDALLEQIPLPLQCPVGGNSQASSEVVGLSLSPQSVSASTKVRLTGTGDVVLHNPKEAVRGLELTFKARRGTQVVEVRPVGRAAGFSADFYQGADGTVKVILVALDGQTIPAGRGPVLKLDIAPAKGAKLRLTRSKVAG
jgi:hypothetical protein